MGPLAIFGITNDGLNLAVKLLLLVVVVLWLALVYWTFVDARRRMEDGVLIGSAMGASFLFPFIGTVIYMIVRPPEYLDDRREREIEIQAAEARLAELEGLACPYCGFDVESSFLRCPSCLRRLKDPCVTCGKPLDPRWKICPYCESQVVGQAQARRRSARPTARTSGRTAARPGDEVAEGGETAVSARRPASG